MKRYTYIMALFYCLSLRFTYIMTLFYCLSLRGQGNNNMRCSIHTMSRQTLWVSRYYIPPPNVLRPTSKSAFRSFSENARSHSQLSLLWISCEKKNTRDLILYDSEIQFVRHFFWHCTDKWISLDFLNYINWLKILNNIYFAWTFRVEITQILVFWYFNWIFT